MSKEIWVALIAASAAVIGPLISWVVARQTRADDRTNITRDLEILKGLNPDSEPHKLLQERVDKNIRRLVESQDRKARVMLPFQLYFTFVACVIIKACTSWLLEQDWLPDDLRGLVQALQLLAPVLSVAVTAILLLYFLQGLWLVGQYIWLNVRLVWLRFSLRRGKYLISRAKKRNEALSELMREAIGQAVSRGMSREEALAISRSAADRMDDEGERGESIKTTMDMYDEAVAIAGKASESSAPQQNPTPASVAEH